MDVNISTERFVATIPDTVITLGSTAFMLNTLITDVVMPDSVTSIGAGGQYGPEPIGCFYGCLNLSQVKLSDNLTSIGDFAFYHCQNLGSIILPMSVASIGRYAFYSSGLSDIYFTGTQAEWEQITIGRDAIPQITTIHYEYVPE